MKGGFIIVLLLCLNLVGYSQHELLNTTKRKLGVNLVAGVGRATFAANPTASSKFPATELRLGVGFTRPLSSFFEIQSRLTFGVKLKREPMNKPGQIYKVGPPYLGLDEMASNRNHGFFELPLLFQFKIPHPKLGWNIGINYRHFFSDGKDVDALRHDVGVITGLTYQNIEKLHIGVDFYFGITKIYSGTLVTPSASYEYYVRNNFINLRLEYPLK